MHEGLHEAASANDGRTQAEEIRKVHRTAVNRSDFVRQCGEASSCTLIGLHDRSGGAEAALTRRLPSPCENGPAPN